MTDQFSKPPDSDNKTENSVEMEAEYICQCFQVQENTIKAHIREGKLKTIEEITEVCGAGGGCQSCHMLLELFLDQFNSPQPKQETKEKETPSPSKRVSLGVYSRNPDPPHPFEASPIMPYSRSNWTYLEIKKALENPVHSESGPKAHSSKHAVEGELASNPMFQAARVNALIIDETHKESNVANYANASKTQQKKHPGPEPEASTHSVLDSSAIAGALETAFNTMPLQTHLGALDAGQDMKLFVNFTNPIGKGTVYKRNASPMDADIICLFVYCKPNPGNADIPIFQTVVPHDQHKNSGNTPSVKI